MDAARLLEPILYSDMFDYSLTMEEIWMYAPIKCTLDEVKHIFSTDPLLKEKVVEKDGCCYFRGRDHIIEIKKQRLQRSKSLWKKARFVASIIQYTPYVKAIAVTGSLAMNNVKDTDDIDFLVLTEEKRLWIVFAVLGTLGRLTRRTLLCPNYYLSIEHYPLKRNDLFTAREITQAKPLTGFSYYKDFLKHNKWVSDYLPNFAHNSNWGAEIPLRPIPKFLKSVVEKLLKGAMGDKLEEILKTVLKSRLHVHHNIFNSPLDEETLRNALNEVEIRFHALAHRESILSEFQKRLKAHICR